MIGYDIGLVCIMRVWLDAGMPVQRVRLVGFLVFGFWSRLGWTCFLGNVCLSYLSYWRLMVGLEIRVFGVLYRLSIWV